MIRGNAEESSAGWHRTAVDAGLAVVFAVLLVVVAAIYGHGGRPWIFDSPGGPNRSPRTQVTVYEDIALVALLTETPNGAAGSSTRNSVR
ncbi:MULTISPECIES: hypothetical protein [unclassified Streptomyces]|uniref:hypothetical protein n=1 Tax=unclassified Streptomyces TaxID=2593676 RepID=UPI0037F95F59